jgi:hypothetical protein
MNCRLIACGLAAIVACALSSGCGSTRWSDTQRTATEQLLISDAIDRAISELDLGALAERKVFLESGAVRATVDSAYLISTLRQHLLAQGCILVDKLEEADYVVELRAGAVGTDRCDLLLGIPATKLPQSVPVQGVPHTIPEFALATKTEQRAVAKIAVFAYNRHTGKLVWQSGIIPVESKIENLWVLGAGPFQRGTIYKGTQPLGQKVRVPLSGKPGRQWQPSIPSVAKEMHYVDGEPSLARRSEEAKGRSLTGDKKSSSSGDVRPTGHSGQSSPTAGSAVPPAPPIPPGPVGTSKHRGFGKTLDLTILDHMNTAPAAAQDSPDAQTAAQPATPSAPTPSGGTPSAATPPSGTASAATPPSGTASAATPGAETSQAAQPAPAPAGGAADPALAAPPAE